MVAVDDIGPQGGASDNPQGYQSSPPSCSGTGRTCLADVKPEKVGWLWRWYVPVGKIITLDGDPGLGKSTVALDIAARVTVGGEWPDGSRCDPPGDVLIMSAEDGVADTIRPRLDAAGADSSRVHVIDHGIDEWGEPKALTLGDIYEIERHITETNARLLVIDVLMAYMPGDANKDQDVRKALTPLAKVAERTECTMLLLRHLRKNKGGEPVHQGGGSIGIVGAARAGYVIVRDPDHDDVRIFASVKSNLASRPKSLTFRLVGAANGAVAVDWTGEDRRSASELLLRHHNALGEISSRISEYVNTRPGTRSADVAKDFGVNPKLANQYLTRLLAGGHIGQIARGVYGPLNDGLEDAEDDEDTEDIEGSEDLGDRSGVGDLDLQEGPASAAGVGQESLHDPHDPQVSPTSSGTEVVASKFNTCAVHGPVGSTGKCVPCIVGRASATGHSAAQDGAQRPGETGWWAITDLPQQATSTNGSRMA